MDARDGGGGGDAFTSSLMAKATKIHELAVREHNLELYYGGMGGGTEAELDRIRRKYAWIPEWFEAYTTLPDPRGYDPLINAMDPVLKVLGQPRAENHVLHPVETAMKGIENARMNLAQWHGDAKDAFLNFSAGWDTMVGNQGMVAYVLKHAMLANQEIFAAARKDLLHIADETINALEAITFWGGGDLKAVLTVFAAVASVASAAATGGSAIALAVVSAAASIGGDAAEDMEKKKEQEAKGKQVTIGADYVDGVLDNMTTATSEVSKLISEKEQEIISALKKDITLVTGTNRDLYIAPRPTDITDLPASKVRDRMVPDRPAG